MSSNYQRIIESQREQIDDLNRKLSKCEGTRSHFISNIRNEIINPFASIHGLAKLIIQAKKEDWKKVISIASMIHKESFMLDFQLINIFSAAELESGETEINFYNSNLTELFNTEINDFNTYAKKRNIVIETEEISKIDIYAITDITKAKVILINLLMNAINFSNDDSKVIVTFNTNNENIHFSVQDFGIGLTRESREKIFNRFSKGNNEINSLNVGLGLGLSVVAGYLELLGGSFDIDTKLGSGTKFTVNIPIPNISKSELDTALSENEFYFDDEIF